MSNSDKVRRKHSLKEKEVLEYLKLNPEIFEKHETFLTKLNLHYDNQGVSSLVKKQLASLRKKISNKEQNIMSSCTMLKLIGRLLQK